MLHTFLKKFWLFLLIPLWVACGNQSVDLAAMSFNIRYANPADSLDYWELRKDMVVDLIRTYDADLVGIQEALPEQISYLSEELPEYGFIYRGRESEPGQGEAVPVMYRDSVWELIRSETFWLSAEPEVAGSNSWNGACNRVATWAVFKHRESGKELVFCNTHFDHVSQAARLNGALLIRKRMDSLAPGYPLILAGDLNGEPDNPAVLALSEYWHDPYPLFHPEEDPAGTYHGFKGYADGKRIDYLLVSDGITAHRLDIIRDHLNGRYPSDHFPVVGHFSF